MTRAMAVRCPKCGRELGKVEADDDVTLWSSTSHENWHKELGEDFAAAGIALPSGWKRFPIRVELPDSAEPTVVIVARCSDGHTTTIQVRQLLWAWRSHTRYWVPSDAPWVQLKPL